MAQPRGAHASLCRAAPASWRVVTVASVWSSPAFNNCTCLPAPPVPSVPTVSCPETRQPLTIRSAKRVHLPNRRRGHDRRCPERAVHQRSPRRTGKCPHCRRRPSDPCARKRRLLPRNPRHNRCFVNTAATIACEVVVKNTIGGRFSLP